MQNVTIKIPEAFQDLWTPARLKVYHGGRGGGKSETVGRYLLVDGMREPQNIVCGREFQKSIKESVHSMLAYLIEDMLIRREYDILDTELRGKNGTRFSFVGLHHNISNIKSMHNIKKFWGEEAQTFSAQSLKVLFPTIRAEDSELIFTMNPELEEDPSYQMLIANPPPDSIVRQVNYYDNPYFPEVLRKEMEHLKATNFTEYLHVWEGKPRAAVEGAVFAEEVRRASEQGRIREVRYDKNKPVDVFFDLGRGDMTAIWFEQQIGYEYRFLRYYQNNRQHFSHYIKYLKELPYAYGTIYLPHDAEHEQLAAEKSIEVQAKEAFSSVQVVPRVKHKSSSIDAARGVFDNCFFDKELCADGLTTLRRYAFKVDPDTGKTSREPEHDTPWSHGADAFQCFAMAVSQEYPSGDAGPGDDIGGGRLG